MIQFFFKNYAVKWPKFSWKKKEENQMLIIQKYASACIRWSQTSLITGERLAGSISNSSVGLVFQSL